MPILARLTLVEGAIHDINLTGFCELCAGFWPARVPYFQWVRGERDALKVLQLA